MTTAPRLRRVLCTHRLSRSGFNQLLDRLSAEGIEIIRRRFDAFESNIVVDCDFDEEQNLQSYPQIRNTASLKGHGIADIGDKEIVFDQLIKAGYVLDRSDICDFGHLAVFFFNVPHDSLDEAKNIKKLHLVGWDEVVHALPG